jgi:GTP cyclohydrolase II
MKLNLKKDIVFFDIESTGLSTSQDRIVQLAIIKYFADGRAPLERCRLVNPTIPISKEASEVHGITDEMVKDEPNFKQIAKGLSDLIGDADLCGFNSNRFDVPMLMEEFARAEVPFDMTDRKTVDVWKIYQKMEPRNLTAALKYYCNEEMEGAHDALNDVRATIKVFEGQLDMYEGKSYDEGKGVILYLNQEGRGIGLLNKLKAYKLQEQGLDTVDANLQLGFKMDERDYGVGAQILRAMGVQKMRLMTNNPTKRAGLIGYGLEIVENVPLAVTPNPHNKKYLDTKRDKMGHELKEDNK